MTFATLSATMAAVLGRDDLTSYIPDFISQAEFRIARDLAPRGFRDYASSTFTASAAGRTIDLPTRFIGMLSFHVLANAAGTGTGSIPYPCYRRDYSFVYEYGGDPASTTGRPKYYAAIDENQAIVSPAPSVAFTFRLAYLAKLAPLSAGNTTNWLTSDAPDLLLYAALLESAPQLRDDARIAMWQAEFDRRAAALTVIEKQWRGEEASMIGGAP